LISNLTAALIAIVGSILGAIGVKIYERLSTENSREVNIESMSFRAKGLDYNDVTVLRTDQDAFFGTYAICNTSKKFITADSILFEVFRDSFVVETDSRPHVGPVVIIDADTGSDNGGVALQFLGTSGRIRINSLAPGAVIYLFVAASFRHFVAFSNDSDHLTVKRQRIGELPSLRKRMRWTQVIYFCSAAVILAVLVWKKLNA
jgi:hypothetical protein